jgi:hypothetical protein
MDGEIEHPYRQVEEALREAVRKFSSDYPQCDNGPDCQCPFHWQSAPLPVEEAALRAHRRNIAGGWHAGTCTGCGTAGDLVKGPPDAKLCKWCDELRILAPAPKPPEPGLADKLRAAVGVPLAVAGLSAALVGAGCLLMLSGQIQAGMAVWAAGVLVNFYQFGK